MSCTFCGKTGHVYDDYYRHIGLPDDFEFTKSKNFQIPVKGNVMVTNEESGNKNTIFEASGNNIYGQYLSQCQYSNLL